jgi:hypothetical protein
MRTFVSVALAVWLAIVVVVAAVGGFVSPPGTIPLGIVGGVTVPLVVFFALFMMSPAFRTFVGAVDLPLVTAIQAWRFAGIGFLALTAHGVLPGAFSWPAGLGDMAIGITSPGVAVALARRPSFATGRFFVVWNLLGILDLVVAVSTGALSSLLATGAATEITTAPMAQLPLVLIPAFLVPLFVMLHLTALFQARQAAFSSVQHDIVGKEKLSWPITS